MTLSYPIFAYQQLIEAAGGLKEPDTQRISQLIDAKLQELRIAHLKEQESMALEWMSLGYSPQELHRLVVADAYTVIMPRSLLPEEWRA